MFICICNALRERELEAAAAGACGVSDVFRRCGGEPKCGKCIADVVKILDEQRPVANSNELSLEVPAA